MKAAYPINKTAHLTKESQMKFYQKESDPYWKFRYKDSQGTVHEMTGFIGFIATIRLAELVQITFDVEIETIGSSSDFSYH